jgi:tetratricopeptide (TPR) repeat protein
VFTELVEAGERRLKSNPADQLVRSRLAADLHNRAIARLNLGDLGGAQADLQEAIRLQTIAREASPEVVEYTQRLGQHYSLLGSMLWEERNLDQAMEMFSKGLAADPDNAELRKQQAWLRYERFEYAEVVQLLERYLDDTKDATLEYLLAVCHLKQNENGKATRVVDRLRTRHPESVEACFLTGVIEMKSQGFQSALEALTAASVIKPQDPAILHNLAICLFHLNRKSEAEQVVVQVHALNAALATTLRQYFSKQDQSKTQVPVLEELWWP